MPSVCCTDGSTEVQGGDRQGQGRDNVHPTPLCAELGTTSQVLITLAVFCSTDMELAGDPAQVSRNWGQVQVMGTLSEAWLLPLQSRDNRAYCRALDCPGDYTEICLQGLWQGQATPCSKESTQEEYQSFVQQLSPGHLVSLAPQWTLRPSPCCLPEHILACSGIRNGIAGV